MAKKKIKDLTKEELKKICIKYNFCVGCPLQVKGKDASSWCVSYLIPYKDKLDKLVEETIEVENDNKES